MVHLQKYDQFINEGKAGDFFGRLKLEISLHSIRAVIKFVRLLFFYSEGATQRLDGAIWGFDRLVSFVRFVYKNKFVHKDILNKSDQEIVETYNKLDQLYTEKFGRCLLEDLKKWGYETLRNISEKGKLEKRKIVPILTKLLNIFDNKENTRLDIDPYGEEEWEDDSNKKNEITPDDITDIRRGQQDYRFGWHVIVTDILKDRLVGKTVLFYEDYENVHKNILNKFMTKIKVKDLYFKDSNVVLVDDKGIHHPTFFPYDFHILPSDKVIIKILD